MNLLALYLAFIGVYMLIVAFRIDTANFKSDVVLKVIPITFGISLIFIGLIKSGLVTAIASTPL